MAMIINSSSCSNAGWWANHVQNAEKNERIEIIGFYGLSARNIEDAFSEMRLMAQESKADNFFSQYNINPVEKLTEAQWQEAHDLHRKNHGLDHLPYFRVRHIKDGREHEHGFALRVDPEIGKAISDSLTAAINERTSRELEIRFGLERGHSVLEPNREEPRPERRPEKWEQFRGAESGLDPAAIGKELAAIKERCDNGQSFKAGMEASGAYVLARGDNRNFVVVDLASDEHSLGRRLGIKAAALRDFMKDIDPATLPSVDQAKEMQAIRAAGLEQRKAEEIGRYDDIRPEAVNQNTRREPVTFEAIARDPWKAVDLEIPRGADPALLATVALCADQCAKAAFAHGRVAVVVDPERAEFYRERHDSAAARRDEARHELAGLPPEQRTVSPLPNREMQDTAFYNITGAYLSGARAEPQPTITAAEIDRNPWNVLGCNVSGASADLLHRVFDTAVELREDALRRRDEASYTPQEARLWDELAGAATDTYKTAQTELVQSHGLKTTFSFERVAARATEPAAPIFDRDAANRAADEKIIDSAIAAAQEPRQRPEHRAGAEQDVPAAHGLYADLQPPQPAPAAKAEPALGKTAGDIRMAWSLSRSASELQEGLAAHGLGLALASAEEARASQRIAAFAKEVGNYARLVREGEIVAVDGIGHVYRLDERTTGQQRPEIEGRLAGLDRAELLNIADTKKAMQEASHAAWVDQQRVERERDRLPNRIESRIAECGREARQDVTIGYLDSEGRLAGRAEVLADRFKPEDEQKIRTATVHGAEAFAARLDDAGIAVVRVTDADMKGLDALRHDESMARVAADTNNEARKPHHFAADLVAGDLAAVTRDGDVYKINPDKLGEAKQYLAADLPGVIETRAKFEIEREQTSALWNEKRAESATTRADFAAEREGQHQAAETARDTRQFNRDIGEAVDTGFKATGGILRSMSRVLENFLSSMFDFFFAPPKLTGDQAERMERVAEEKAEARAADTAAQEKAAAVDWAQFERNRQQQYEDFMNGRTTTRQRERDDDEYERERGRDRER